MATVSSPIPRSSTGLKDGHDPSSTPSNQPSTWSRLAQVLLCAAALKSAGCGTGDPSVQGQPVPSGETSAMLADTASVAALDREMESGFTLVSVGRQASMSLQVNAFNGNVFEVHGCQVRYHYGDGTIFGGPDLPSYVILNPMQVMRFQSLTQQTERNYWDWDLNKIVAKQLRNCAAGYGPAENPGDAAGLQLAMASGVYPSLSRRQDSGAIVIQDILEQESEDPPSDVFELHGCEVRYHSGAAPDNTTDLSTYVVLQPSEVKFLQGQLTASAAGLQSSDAVLKQAVDQLSACP